MSNSQYELIDPSGRVFKVAAFDGLVAGLRKGYIFPSTRIKGGQGSAAMVGGLPGIQTVFEELISDPNLATHGAKNTEVAGHLGPLSIAKCLSIFKIEVHLLIHFEIALGVLAATPHHIAP